MKKSTITIKFILTVSVLLISLVACKTVPTEVSPTVTEAELFQLAQTEIDNDNPEAARFYFEKVITMFGTNYSSLVMAEYELAHLDIKEKKYAKAKPELEKVISYYDDPDLAQLLNPSYKKLALIDLEKCK